MDGACWEFFFLRAFTCLGHECQDLLSPCDGMHLCTDKTLVYTSSERVFWGNGVRPMLTPRKKSPLPENFSSKEDGTHGTAPSRTASPTHYQQAIPALEDRDDSVTNVHCTSTASPTHYQ